MSKIYKEFLPLNKKKTPTQQKLKRKGYKEHAGHSQVAFLF